MANPLQDLIARLDALDGRKVTVTEEHVRTESVNREIHRGGRDRDIEDLAERVAHELGKRLRREGLQ